MDFFDADIQIPETWDVVASSFCVLTFQETKFLPIIKESDFIIKRLQWKMRMRDFAKQKS